MIGDDFQRIILQIGRVGFARGGLDQHLEQIDFVIAVHMLQYRGQAFEPHAGIDALLRQRRERGGAGLGIDLAVELHEHVVPDFDIAIAVLLRAARRPAPDIGTVIVKNFGARAARAGIGHLPEIVGRIRRALVVADAHHALFRQADFIDPDIVGFVVGFIYRGPQLVGRQAVDGRQQFPGPLQRIALEIVAERPVAEHFKKGMVTRGVADVFQIVMLAAGAQTALHRGGAHVIAFVRAQEHVLELHHAGIGKQQRRVVARHQAGRTDDGMALGFEKFQEFVANFC